MTPPATAPPPALAGTDRLAARAAWGAAACLFLALVAPALSGRLFVNDDLGTFHLPLRVRYAEAIDRGHSILWSSEWFGGFYVHAEGQTGASHPWHLLLYALLPTDLAFHVELTSSYVAAFAGMLLFLRRAGLGRSASVVGATVYACSGFALLRLPHMNGIAIAAHVPWLLLSLDLVLRGSRRAWPPAVAAAAVLVGSQVLLGYPQYVWMSALVCGLFVMVRASGAAGPVRWALAALAGGSGLAIGAAQLLPTLDLLARSVRASVPEGFALTLSLHPLNLLQLVSPYLFKGRVYAEDTERFVHEFGVYDGGLAVLALVWVAVRRRQLRTPIVGFGALLCLAGTVLALGRFLPIYEYLSGLPLFGTLRGATRHVLVLHTGLAILVGVAIDDLVRGERWPGPLPRATLAPAAISVGLVCAAATMPFAAPARSLPLSVAGAAAGAALMIGATVLFRDAARGHRIACALLPIFAAVDLGVYGFSYLWTMPPRSRAALAAEVELPPSVKSGTLVHASGWDARRNLLLLHGLGLFRAYVGLTPLRALPESDPQAQRLAGVRWVHEGGGWRRVEDPMPRLRVVYEARVSAHPSADLAGIDIRQTALVSEPIGALGPAGEATIQVLLDESGRLEVDVEAPGRALLVWTEAYDPGWVASAGAAPLSVMPVYGDHVGVVVEPGRARVALRFAPASARWGVVVSVAVLAAVLGSTLAAVWAAGSTGR